jgi:putative transcriptional regulator
MGSKKMKIQDVCNKTGLSRNTVAFLYHEKVKRIDFDTIAKLCELFDCNTQQLLEYAPPDSADLADLEE